MKMACGVPQKCSERYAGLIRAYVIAAAAAVVGAAACAIMRIGIAAALISALLIPALLWAVVSLPEIYAAGVVYTRHRDWLMVERGIIWRQAIMVPRGQIQYIRQQRGALERLFGLSTLVLMTSGGRIYMRGLAPEDAQRLRRVIGKG